MKKLLELSGVTINIKGRNILQNFSLALSQETGVIGLVGLNGAGKTTFIKTIFDWYPLASGSITKYNSHFAFCPDVPDFPTNLTAIEVLRYSSLLSKNKEETEDVYKAVLSSVGIKHEDMYREISYFSRGMKQRLGVATVLILKPHVIFLDEPTSALDPKGREEMIQLIGELGKKLLVMFSSHILHDVEKVADHIIVIHKGNKIFDGPIVDLPKKNGHNIIIKCKNSLSLSRVEELLRENDLSVTKLGSELYIHFEEMKGILNQLDEQMLTEIISIKREEHTLENSFDCLIEQSEA